MLTDQNFHFFIFCAILLLFAIALVIDSFKEIDDFLADVKAKIRNFFYGRLVV